MKENKARSKGGEKRGGRRGGAMVREKSPMGGRQTVSYFGERMAEQKHDVLQSLLSDGQEL